MKDQLPIIIFLSIFVIGNFMVMKARKQLSLEDQGKLVNMSNLPWSYLIVFVIIIIGLLLMDYEIKSKAHGMTLYIGTGILIIALLGVGIWRRICTFKRFIKAQLPKKYVYTTVTWSFIHLATAAAFIIYIYYAKPMNF